MKKVFLLTAFVSLLFSCQQDQVSEKSATDADIVARSMKFMTLSQSFERLKKTKVETRVSIPDGDVQRNIAEALASVISLGFLP